MTGLVQDWNDKHPDQTVAVNEAGRGKAMNFGGSNCPFTATWKQTKCWFLLSSEDRIISVPWQQRPESASRSWALLPQVNGVRGQSQDLVAKMREVSDTIASWLKLEVGRKEATDRLVST